MLAMLLTTLSRSLSRTESYCMRMVSTTDMEICFSFSELLSGVTIRKILHRKLDSCKSLT
jgi:hypothetical protein